MARISRKKRRILAALVWFFGIMLAFGMGIWAYSVNSSDADSRLLGEAARSAGELAGLLSHSALPDDPALAHALVDGALEDERIYAVKITLNNRMLAGQRRNYLWEPISWDDEITENSVQGMNPVKVYGKPAGWVEVWISTRAVKEEKALLLSRELWRFGIFALLWTIAFFLLLWYWGDWKRLAKLIKKSHEEGDGTAEKIILQLSQAQNEKPEVKEEDVAGAVNANAGRRHQRCDPDSWFVTAGMFRQTFSQGPKLMNRLYADGETACLCHLGRMLEQAAPCVGADKLLRTAREMQKHLNDPDSAAEASSVENCVTALQEVLDALCGNSPWSARTRKAGS